jgi:hypothetical protein
MYKSTTKCNETLGKWCKNKHGASKIIDTFETYHSTCTRPASLEEIKSCVQRKDETLRSYIQRWSVIKNSAEDISHGQAIDAFSTSLRRSDLVEEVGRTKPRTVSELMEVANRFTDREDAYNNK